MRSQWEAASPAVIKSELCHTELLARVSLA